MYIHRNPPPKKKTVEHKSDGDTTLSWCTRNSSQILGKETGGAGYQNRDYFDHSIVKRDNNIQKSIGNLKRLAIAQAPVKNYQVVE